VKADRLHSMIIHERRREDKYAALHCFTPQHFIARETIALMSWPRVLPLSRCSFVPESSAVHSDGACEKLQEDGASLNAWEQRVELF
jgi:hypothetical protein